MSDNVSHPYHYEGSTSIECIDTMELVFGAEAVINFCLCNSFKYLWRWKNKNGLEDLDKAAWYLNKKEELSKKLDWAVCEEETKKLQEMIKDAKENVNEEH